MTDTNDKQRPEPGINKGPLVFAGVALFLLSAVFWGKPVFNFVTQLF